MQIGKLKKLPLREVWPNEARNFTPWLKDNIEHINELLGLNISVIESERRSGSFSLDLYAQDENGDIVIIENQIEKTDHDHLGKLITYTSAHEAKISIWITSEARSEHTKSINWLNDNTDTHSFYLIQVEVVRIGNSDPAPSFTLITGPSEISGEVNSTKKDRSEQSKKYIDFWRNFLEISNKKTDIFATITPKYRHWNGVPTKKHGCSFGLNFGKKQTTGSLYIDLGIGKDKENLEIYNEFFKNKEIIEKKYGGDLNWKGEDNYRRCQVSFKVEDLGYDTNNWDEKMNLLVDNLIRFDLSLKDVLDPK